MLRSIIETMSYQHKNIFKLEHAIHLKKKKKIYKPIIKKVIIPLSMLFYLFIILIRRYFLCTFFFPLKNQMIYLLQLSQCLISKLFLT